MGVSFTIEGAQELQDALRALPEKVAKKFMKAALHDGAEIVLEAAKAAAPVGKTGALRDGLEVADEKGNVVVRTGQGNTKIQRELRRIAREADRKVKAAGGNMDERRAAKHQVYVEARNRAKKAGIEYQGQYYGNMIEWGTKKMEARPFIQPALASTSGEATEAIAEKLKEQIEEEAFN